jgi:hypothetical protein
MERVCRVRAKGHIVVEVNRQIVSSDIRTGKAIRSTLRAQHAPYLAAKRMHDAPAALRQALDRIIGKMTLIRHPAALRPGPVLLGQACLTGNRTALGDASLNKGER